MHCASYMHSKKDIKSHKIGLGVSIVASHWTGTTRQVYWTSPCQYIQRKCSTSYITPHSTPSRPHHYPYQWNPPKYGSTAPQLAHQAPELSKLPPPEANIVQQVVGTFLYYERAVDPTMLVELNSIASEQDNITEATIKAVTHLLNYAATHSESITRYHASGMILHIHSNASFLSEPGASIRKGGYHYLGTASSDPDKAPLKQPPLNGPVHVKCTIMRNVLSSAMEAELGALFLTVREAQQCAWLS